MSVDQTPPSQLPTERAVEIIRSFEARLGRSLLPTLSPNDSDQVQAAKLWRWSNIVVAHGTEDDPVLNYANQAAVRLWETDLDTLLKMPSRLTAEPMHRDERAAMLERTLRDGYIDDYQGVRITATGRRFFIERAIVWNVTSADGEPAGQAATFEKSDFI